MRAMREALHHHYDQFLKVVAWSGVAIGLALLGIDLMYLLGCSPFQDPGAALAPDDRVELLRLDSVRWLAIAITGSICGVRRAPRRRSRFERGPGASVALPLSVLMAVIAMALVSTVCWFYWMKHLPGGDRMQNALLGGGYFVLPAALLATFAASLFSRSAD
jgi:hypothetical protein